MIKEKSAIIIGAGIGGLSTSIFLARKGYKVDIFEKNMYPGGRCGQILREGHRFDIGATILLMPSIYRNVFESLGLNFDDCFELKALPSVYKIYFENGISLSFSSQKELMEKQLEAIEPGSYVAFTKYIATGYEFFQKSLSQLLGRNFFHTSEFVTLRNAALLINLKTYLKHKTFIRRFFKNNELQQAFIFQNIYVGQNPLTSPALFSMLPAAELTEGALFPIGGMYSITEKLRDTATELGVNIHYNKAVSKICISGKIAKSIELSDGTICNADIFVANADLPYVYRDLLPDRNAARRIQRKKYTCSAMVFHWGLKKVYSELGHHSVFLSSDFKYSLEKIFKEYSLSGDPSFYVHSPVRTDPAAAPPGEDSLTVVIPMGHIDAKHPQQWNELIKMARTAVLNRLKTIGMNDIEENIKFEICYPPTSWKSIFNVSKGSVFGSLKHSIFQMGYFRPHNRHNKYRNLYFSGGSTHPGNGVPLVLMSAKLTSERILKEN
jgi:phytoene desaturase